MRAFGYVRLSKEDATSTSPQRQRKQIKDLCQARGWQLVEIFEDINVSAYNGKATRPEFARMMSRLSEADAIVFWRLDRLSRSVLHFSNILEQTQDADVQLVSTAQPIDTTTAMGKAFVQITAVFAELEVATLSERSRGMMSHKRDNDEWVGREPYGWKVEGKHLVPDPSEQRTLSEAAQGFIDGATYQELADRHGFSAPSVIRAMLRSERVQDALPPDLGEKLLDALKARKFQRVPLSKQSLLAGIARCGECGKGMRKASGRKDGGYSYACPDSHAAITGPWLEQTVIDAVIEAIDIEKLVAAVKDDAQITTPRKVSELEARLEALEDAHFVDGAISADRYKRLRGQLVDQIEAARQAGLSRHPVEIPIELARNLGEKWDTLDLDQQRGIISAVVESVDIAKAKGPGPLDPGRASIVWRA